MPQGGVSSQQILVTPLPPRIPESLRVVGLAKSRAHLHETPSTAPLLSMSCKRVRNSFKTKTIISLCFHTHPHSFSASPLFAALKKITPGVYRLSLHHNLKPLLELLNPPRTTCKSGLSQLSNFNAEIAAFASHYLAHHPVFRPRFTFPPSLANVSVERARLDRTRSHGA